MKSLGPVDRLSANIVMLVAILCEGHILLEDMPGLGKTLLAKVFARSLGFLQLPPSDRTGR